MEEHQGTIEVKCLGGYCHIYPILKCMLGPLFEDVEVGEDISIPVNINDFLSLSAVLLNRPNTDMEKLLKLLKEDGLTHHGALRAGAFLGVKTPSLYRFVYEHEIKPVEASHEWMKVFSETYLYKY